MAFDGFFHAVAQLLDGGQAETSLSRRDMLSGIGLVGALAFAGPTILMPASADAVELLDDDESGEQVEQVSYRRRGRRRGRRGGRRRLRRGRRRLHAGRRLRRRRRRPSVHFHFSTPHHYYTPRRYYGGSCDYWAQMCASNWGYGNRNYYGCMRYHGCW